ncbi:hypothetical protein J437_LFUL005929 [Ladona fulva]|uniref:Uncharacterized protein n=1 Tax=Ladona fulva TaxID=123851 RepID=A0A8K0K009_LADFU|nr:hypothetical protein J437_LFUL005929 [Ladona fulva]
MNSLCNSRVRRGGVRNQRPGVRGRAMDARSNTRPRQRHPPSRTGVCRSNSCSRGMLACTNAKYPHTLPHPYSSS